MDWRNSVNHRQDWLLRLEERYLLGGALIPEWCTLMCYETDTCFLAGADISTIIVATSAIEIYLRADVGGNKSKRLVELIDEAGLPDELATDINRLRKIRNKWVHLRKPDETNELKCYSDAYTKELESNAYFACETLRRVIFSNQLV